MKRKVLAVLLALTMVVSLLPGTVFATGGETASSGNYKGYVSSLTASITADGTAAFTNPSDSTDPTKDTDGNDSSDHNGVVRTFDTVEYQMAATFAALSDTETATEATLHFEMILPMGITQAQFDLDKMNWMGTNYLIEYLDNDGNVVGKKDNTCAEGEYYTVNGTTETKTTINDNASGSEQGQDSYSVSGIVSQRITATMELKATESNPTVIPGTQKLSAGVKILNAKNGDTLEPSFKVWLDNNTENYGYASTTNKTGELTAQSSNTVSMSGAYNSTNRTGAVTVSAGARYNTEIRKSDYLAYRSWFDFSTGKELTEKSTDPYTVGDDTVKASDVYNLLETLGTLEENYGKSNPAEYTDSKEAASSLLKGHDLSDYSSILSNIRYGRMYSYGIAVQMVNRDSSGGLAMKGLSLPEGTISLDLQVAANATSSNETVDTDQYYSVLWDYKENVSNTDPGKQVRNLTWDNGNTNTRYARGTVPFNSGGGKASCYNGGTWSMTSVNDGNTTSSASTANNAVYSFSVSGYDIDLDDYTFPRTKSTSSADYAPYVTYEYNISAGQAQVLSVFPRTDAGTVDVSQTVTVGNLSAQTLSGQTVSKKNSSTPEAAVCYDYEINTNGIDNTMPTGVTFYRPGTASRHSSFVTRASNSCAQTYLGKTGSTDTYWVQSYDSTAYVGDKIAIWGDCCIKEGSDETIKAFNLLQLFDSKVFSIDEDADSTAEGNKLNDKTNYQNRIQIMMRSGTYDDGASKILYAADPDYKGGYDTNAEGVQAYMNSVREDDLVYYESLSALESAGYTCIGVLAEVRGCKDVKGGYDQGYCGVRIPVKVNDVEGVVGKTVSTTNSVNIWVTDGAMMEDGKSISWTNGKWDEATKKNKLDGYQTITRFNSAEVAGDGNGFILNNGDGTSGYLKAEFDGGQLVSGTPKGGYLYGCTLMVLGYKAGVSIDSEKPDGQKNYNLSNEPGTVTYTLSDIRTDLEGHASSPQGNTTSLTINLDLDGVDKNGATISDADLDATLLKGNYSVVLTSEDDTKTTLKVGESESEPTTIYYYFETTTDENKDEVTVIKFCAEPKKAGDNGIAKGTEGHKEWKDTQPMTIWADSSDTSGKSAKIHIDGAPVGWTLPDITAQAQLQNTLANGDKITATATISGSGDNRAYEEINGNYAADTVSIINLGASALTKTVSNRLIELNGEVTYTITYTNKSTAALSDNLYLYDLLPYEKDIRGSGYSGTTKLTSVGATIVDGSGKTVNFGNTTVTVYYSTKNAAELRGEIEGFNGKSASAIDTMLTKTGGDFTTLGELNGSTSTLNVRGNVQSQVTCVYAVATNLGANYSIKLNLNMDTDGNAAADNYGNLAWGYVPSQGGELRTTIVQTQVVSRSISGVVWLDANANGVRDTNEQLMDGVTCGLFKQEKDGTYSLCTTNVTGQSIGTTKTSNDGAYSFDKLSAGNYVVAFQIPNKWQGKVAGVTTYRSGKASATNSSGVKNTYSGVDANTYTYAIAYTLDNNSAGPVTLHGLDAYNKNSSLLKDYQENVAFQNLGLVPPTGDLKITKTVSAPADITAPDQNFTFTVTLKNGEEALAGTYNWTKYDKAGQAMTGEGSTGTISSGKTVTLKADQSVTITGIPDDTNYTVTEDGAGTEWTTTKTNDTGTIEKGKTKTAAFTNSYIPTPATLEGSTNLNVSKTLTGRDAAENESFTFTLKPEKDNAPMPKNSAGETVDTVSISGLKDKEAKTASFGDISYTTAGTYNYTITETSKSEDENLTMSQAEYRVTVTVNAKGSDLEATSTMTQVTDDAGAEVNTDVTNNTASFTNTYTKPDQKKTVRTAETPETSINGKMVGVGDEITYTITWNNDAIDETGKAVAANITVTDTLPTGVTYRSATVDGAAPAENVPTRDGQTLTFNLGEQAANASGTITITVTVNESAAQTLENQAIIKVGDNEYETNKVANTVPQKTVSENLSKIQVGQKLTYSITFEADTDGTATIEDTLSKGLKYNKDAKLKDMDWSPTTTGSSSETGGTTLTWANISVTEGTTYTLTFSVTVTEDGIKTVTNQATVNGHKTNVVTTPMDEPNSLTISKTVEVPDSLKQDEETAKDTAFTFAVSLTDSEGNALTKAYSYTGTGVENGTIKNGDTITLKTDQSITITGLPAGAKYTVTEKGNNDFVKESSGTSGTISSTSAEASFTNTYVKPTKTVSTSTESGVQVGDVLTYTIGWVNYASKTATVTVADTLPTGLTYVKTDNDGVTYDEATRTLTWTIENAASLADGTVTFQARVNENALVTNKTKNTATVMIDNVSKVTNETPDQKPSTGDLSIAKTVSGSRGDTTKGFTFTVEAKDKTGNALTGTYTTSKVTAAADAAATPAEPVAGSVTFSEGKATLTLKHNETVTIKDLPAGAAYTVTESGSEGYTVTKTGDTGTIAADTTAQAVFENYRGGGGGGGGDPTTPTLNTEDHYGYIIGYPKDYETGEPTRDTSRWPVKPEGNITRAEVATIYFRMLTDESRNTYWSQTNSYSDVDLDDWYNNAISTLANAGILSGYPDGTFRPNASVTRAELATIAVRFFDASYEGEDLFPDIDGHWAQDYINQAASKGFVNGYTDGTFAPDKAITRAETMTLVNRTLDRHPDAEHFTSDMIVWPDNADTSAWYYADVQEATNSHEYDMKTDSNEDKQENWTKTLPMRDWEAFEKAWSDANSASNPGEVVNK